MLENKFNSQFLEINVDDSISYFEVNIKKKTNKMSEESFEEETRIWTDLLEEYNPKFHLLNGRYMFFLLDSDIQDWLVVNLLSKMLKSGVEKLAFVFSEDKLVAFTQKITVDISQPNSINIEFFVSDDLAKHWLLDN